MDAIWSDLRFAFRAIRREPTFTLVAVLTLAVGIGIATATFTVANGILFRSLPVREEDRVVVMWAKQRDFAHVPFRWSDLDRFSRSTRAFRSVGGIDYNGAWTWAMADRGEPTPVQGTYVTGAFFDVLGIVPQVGRVIHARDDVPNAPRVAMITDGLWRRRYGADPSTVGRQLTYDGQTYTIIGVGPRGFEYPRGVELWTALLPSVPNAVSDTAPGSIDLVARLRSDATMNQGRVELDRFLDVAYAKWRTSIGKFEATARTLPDVVVGSVKQRVVTLLAASALVLVIACMNVANLLLVRAVTRSREVAIRASLGATRRRIVGQLMTESAVLAVGAVVLGTVMAAGAVRVLLAFAPPDVPRLAEVTLDKGALIFACGVTIAAALSFGLGPAIALSRRDGVAALRYVASRLATSSRGSARTKRALVVMQAALATVVLVAAGLLGRSLMNLQRLSLGFEGDRLVIAQLTMPWSRFNTDDGGQRFASLLDRFEDAVKAVPGVSAVAVASSPPYSGTGGWDALPTTDDAVGDARRSWVNMEIVTPGYFATLGVPLQRGRVFSRSDQRGAPPVVVVNDAMARAYWPGESAIGKRLRLGAATDTTAPRYTVVGIVGDMRYRELTAAMPSFYLPNAQFDRGAPTFFMVRTALDPAALISALRRTVSAVDSDASILSARTMDDYLAGPLARPRFSSLLGLVYAGVALVLITVGVAAVIGEHVRQRRRELGIRLALGATNVRRSVLQSGLGPVLVGIAIGAAVSVGASRVVASQLYNVSPTDAATLLVAGSVVLLVSTLACAVPASRAARVDPAEVLRSE